jgi:hypothetical protein
MTTSQISNSIWDELSKEWPDLILLKDIKNLQNFPYSANYIRNLCTGSNADPELIKHVIRVGKFPALPKTATVRWLTQRTV